MTGLEWFKNVGKSVFHLPSEEWVRTGRAVCGVDISKPEIFVRNPCDLQRLCKRCKKVQNGK